MIKFMAKVYYTQGTSTEGVQISDWTLFSLGTFVGSANYIRPASTLTQLNPLDWDIDWDTCFPGKFFRICNSQAPIANNTHFFLCFSNEFDSNKSIRIDASGTVSSADVWYGPRSVIPSPNTNNYVVDTRNYWKTTAQHSPSDYNYCWVFSDIPYYNEVFISFDEIVNYSRTDILFKPNYNYCVFKDQSDPTHYYGWSDNFFITGYINYPFPIKNLCFFFSELVAQSPVQVDTDPYVDGGGYSSGGEGGGGAFDGSSDIIQPLPLNLPDVTDILKIYHVADSLLGTLAQSICSQSYTNWQSYLPMFNNPLEALISLHWLPITLPTGTHSQNIVIGRYDTGVSTDLIDNQFIELDMGSVTVPEFWGNYLDYDATRIQLFLPYIGCINLAPDEVVKQTVKIKYNVDVLTGTCTAIVYTQGDTIIYSGSGSMLVQIPLSSVTYGNVVSTILTSGISLLSQGLMAYGSGGASLAGGATTILANATALMSSKPSFSKTGFVGMSAGAMAYDKPYLLISRVKQCVPQNNNKFSGYPLYVTTNLSTLTGFTQVDNIHINNTQATEYEVNEIIKLLREGVIL